jgi:lauroyl/myristoyl acyltransferase
VSVQFCLAYLDRLWHFHFGHQVKWEVAGLENIKKLQSIEGGVMIFTAHSGNFDIGVSLFAKHFNRAIHVVRMRESAPRLQELRENEMKRLQSESPSVKVHYSQSEWNLGFDLLDLLRAGHAVTVQGDRQVEGASVITLEQDGVAFRIPRGPLALAELAAVPCFPIFMVRKGRCHYEIQVGPAFYEGTTSQRSSNIGMCWLSHLNDFLQRHWDQWFVFQRLVSLSGTRGRENDRHVFTKTQKQTGQSCA